MGNLTKLDLSRVLKTLKNTLLEYIVLHMDEIFPQRRLCDIWTRVDTTDDFPCLPDGLFEEILKKSTDMWWLIRPEQLVSCFIHRQKLEWRNLDYFLQAVTLKAADVKSILNSPVKPSRLCLNFEKDEKDELITLRDISQLAECLEVLKIYFPQNFPPTILKRHHFGNEDETKLKLKEFVYNANLESFPALLDFSTLIILFLDNSVLTRFSLEIIRLFKNLIHLSLYNTELYKIKTKDVVKAVITLKNLRILNMTSDWARFEPAEELVKKIMSNLPCLEILEIMNITQNYSGDWDTDRKLKVLIAKGAINLSKVTLMNLTHKAANYKSLESTLAVCESTSNLNMLRRSQLELMFFIDDLSRRGPIDSSAIDFKRIEQMMDRFVQYAQSCLMIYPFAILNILGPLYFSPEFIEKAMCLIGSSSTCDYMKNKLMKSFSEFLQGNKRTHVRKRLVEILAESA